MNLLGPEESLLAGSRGAEGYHPRRTPGAGLRETHRGSTTAEITSSQRPPGDDPRWERDPMGATGTPQGGRAEGQAP